MSTPSTLRQGVADEIRAEMARQRKTGVQLAAVLNCSQQTASRRLSGEVSFDFDELVVIATWLGVHPTRLIPWPEPASLAHTA